MGSPAILIANATSVGYHHIRASQRILEEQRRQDEKRRVKRAANRKSASTSRARKKAYVDDMTTKNERMRQHALILSMLPDLVLAVCRSGEMTYVSPACQWLLLHTQEEVLGANIFELVTQDCHGVLRKMISENLSRPVQSLREPSEKSQSSGEATDRSDTNSVSGGSIRRNAAQISSGIPQGASQRDSLVHRDRIQQRFRPSQPGQVVRNAAKQSTRGGHERISTPFSRGPNMLRLIRCDKTTVWCEARLSVRKARGDNPNPTPIEIILTLRNVSEGKKAAMSHGLPGALTPVPESVTSAQSQTYGEGMQDDHDYVEDDDDGYHCEEDEDSNNSSSGNDSGTRIDRVKSKAAAGKAPATLTNSETERKMSVTDDLDTGREERSLSKKRQRMEAAGADEAVASNKSGEEDSSTAGDTGGSTTQEGTASFSLEADSNCEGSNNGSKWEDGCVGDTGSNNGTQCGEFGGSEDGSSDLSSAAADSGEEVQIQNAVQGLMRVRYSEGSTQ